MVRHFQGVFLLSALMGFSAGTITAQAVDTAETRVRIYTFGMVSYVDPKYGGAQSNLGATIGSDLNIKRLGTHWEPGLEIRMVGSGGRLSRQYDYAFGPRIQYDWNRLHPYAEFLVGLGHIHFERPILTPKGFYVADNSLTYNFGSGFDFSLTSHWATRADFLYQDWRFKPSQGDFNPWSASVGVRYQFIFRSRGNP